MFARSVTHLVVSPAQMYDGWWPNYFFSTKGSHRKRTHSKITVCGVLLVFFSEVATSEGQCVPYSESSVF